jgi:hypothetical protein
MIKVKSFYVFLLIASMGGFLCAEPQPAEVWKKKVESKLNPAALAHYKALNESGKVEFFQDVLRAGHEKDKDFPDVPRDVPPIREVDLLPSPFPKGGVSKPTLPAKTPLK